MTKQIRDAFRLAWRRFVVDGVPSSGDQEPDKDEIQPIGDLIASAIDQVKQLVSVATQWKTPVRAASLTNVTLASIVNGTSFGGVTVATGDRIAFLGQTSAAANGIYVVQAASTPVRATDADAGSEVLGMAFYVREGTNGGKQFACTATGDITVGTTALPFQEVSDQSALNADIADLTTSVEGLVGGIGPVFSEVATDAQANNGAELTADTFGRTTGWTIPAGVSGVNTFLRPRVLLPQDLRASAVGQRVTVTAGALTSAGYTRAITPVIKVITTAGAIVDLSTIVDRNEQAASTTHIITMSATLPADVLAIYPSYSSTGAGPAGADEHFELTSLDVRFGAEAQAQTDAQANDAALSSFAVSRVRDDTVLGGAFERAIESGQWLNGAVARNDATGRRMGWTIPIGSTGISSYVRPVFEVPKNIRSRLTGRVLTVTAICATSNNYFRTITPVIQAVLENGTTQSLTTTVVRSVQAQAALRIVEFRATLPASVKRLMPYLQQTSTGAAVAEEWVLISDMLLRIAETAAVAGGPLTDQLSWISETETARRIADSSAGRALDDATLVPQVFNGAVVRKDAFGRSAGWTIPVGQAGTSTLLQPILQLDRRDRRALAGRRVRCEAIFSTSADYSKNIGVLGQVALVGGGTRTPTIETVHNVPLGSGFRLIQFEHDIVGDEAALQSYFQSTTGGAAAAEMWVLLIALRYRIVSEDATQRENVDWALSNARRLAAEKTLELTDPHYVYPIMATVAADGSGDYLKPSLADAGIVDASIIDKAQVTIERGVYNEVNWPVAAHKVWRGRDRADCVIQMLQAADTALVTIAANSTLFPNFALELRNLTILVKNGRYAIHSDSGTAVKDSLQIIENCRIEHLGNKEAEDYQVAHGGSAGDVWQSTHAIGFGSSSGSRLQVSRSEIIGYRAGLQFHTNGGHSKPAEVRIHDSRLVARNPLPDAYALVLQPLGTFQDDYCQLIGNQIEGDIQYFPDPWIPTTLAQQPANHAEIRVEGFGNSPAVFLSQDFGRALRIDDASTADGSGISVSGSAAAVLFGQEVYSIPGAGGTPGYLYGWADVSGVGVGSGRNVLITSLGQRLGDCSTVSKSLVVTPAGGSPITVTFNQNHVAQSNATVLGIINAALGAAAVASLYNVGGRYRPMLKDEERSLKNTSATTLLMGMVLAYDSDNRSVRAMTSADAASLFAGVAWEDIYPGAFGRVKTSGYLPISDVLRTDAAAFGFGDTFSITAGQPGRVSKGGTQGLLRAIRSNAVRVG